MTAKRKAGFDLGKAIQDPGFSPRDRDVPELLARLAIEDEADAAERALLRVDARIADRAAAEAGESASHRVRLTRLLGKLAAKGDGDDAVLATRLREPDGRVRRAAAIALGKLDLDDGVEAALADALAGEADASVRRAIVAALGKAGGERALAAVREAGSEEGAAKAALMIERTLSRAEPSSIDASIAPARPLRVLLRCRAGLEEVLMSELGRYTPRVRRDVFGAAIEVVLDGPMSQIFEARTMLRFGIPIRTAPLDEDSDPAQVVASALASKDARAILERWTSGPIRYRIAWARGGKRRAAVWRAAEQTAKTESRLVNDPTSSTWEVVVHERDGKVGIELVPNVPDPRFTYRRGDVPAASNPTIAAALVRVAGIRADDIVLDPFVGSGLELCERAIAGSYGRLFGSDLSPAALDVARANLDAAGASAAELFVADARTVAPPLAPTAIITNPPLGRRVQRGAGLGALLEAFVFHAARILAPGGRFVWISPLAARTGEAAVRAGLRELVAYEVDLGGFAATLQAFEKPR